MPESETESGVLHFLTLESESRVPQKNKDSTSLLQRQLLVGVPVLENLTFESVTLKIPFDL